MATRVKLKTQKIKNEREKRPHAHANHIRISPTKVRIVLDIVRGKSVNSALAILRNTPKSASEPVYRLISSAIANAENNLNLSREDLYVAEIYASGGPVLKRSMPRAKGRLVRILKRTSHITVILDQMNDEIVESVNKTKTTKKSTNQKPVAKQDGKKSTTSSKSNEKVETKKIETKSTKNDASNKIDNKTTNAKTNTKPQTKSATSANEKSKVETQKSEQKTTTPTDTAKGEQK